MHWLNEERRTEKRRKDLEAKQKQTLSSLLKMKILQRGSDRESVLRARWKSLLLRLTSSAQPRQQERERESAGHSNSAQKNKKKLHINPGYHCSTHSAWQNQKAIQSKHGNCGDDKSQHGWRRIPQTSLIMYSGKISFNRIVSHKRRYYNY